MLQWYSILMVRCEKLLPAPHIHGFGAGTLITIDGDIHSGQLAQNPKIPLAYVLDGEDDLTFIYNVSSPTIYSSQELSQGPHTLAIRLLNENTTFSVSGGNITISQPESQPNNHHRTIAIVAGTLGGLVIVVVVLLALFLFSRRRHTSNNGACRLIRPSYSH